MSKIKKNKTTGLELLLIGKQKFYADNEGIFKMDLADVKKILINELPLDRKCLTCNETKLEQLTSSIVTYSPDKINLLFVRRNACLVEITIAEVVYPEDLDIEITTKYFCTLRESVLLANKSLNSKIIKHECNSHGQVYFEFSIELTASTIEEAFGKAVKINTSLDGIIMDAVEKGTNCISFVLEGAFHIKLPDNLFGNSANDKNSVV
jgi:hypothetical protein